jgi:hypothetical protein
MTRPLRRTLQTVLIVTVIPFVAATADVPAIINFQGQVLDAGGVAATGSVTIDIGIWDSGSGGTRIYREQHPNTPLVNGVYNVLIGKGSNAASTLNADTFSAPSRWLELAINGETLTPRQPFSSVAYALQAQRAVNADTVDGIDSAALMPKSGGTFTGAVAVNGPGGNANVSLTSLAGNADRGFIAVRDAGASRVEMYADANGHGAVRLLNSAGNARVVLLAQTNGGSFGTIGASGKTSVLLSSLDNGGSLAALDPNGDVRAFMSLVNGAGNVTTYGPNGSENAQVGPSATNANHGAITAHDDAGDSRASVFVEDSGSGAVTVANTNGGRGAEMRVYATGEGYVHTLGPNGTQNALMSAVIGYPNNGAVAVLDANGNVQAGMLVNSSGRGEMFADVKNFIVDHPTRPGARIVYTSLEGPEVAIYHRGVVALVNGRASIELPEHFTALAKPDSVTVQLTPVSLRSLGLGVEAIGDGRIEIGELHDGTGSYDVHFVVHAVRQGYEERQPVIDAAALQVRSARGAAATPLDLISVPRVTGGPGGGGAAPSRAEKREAVTATAAMLAAGAGTPGGNQ